MSLWVCIIIESFPKYFFRYCSVHQHGRRDVTWKPRIPAFMSKLIPRELKQTRWRRKRERHLKMQLRVSAIIFQLFKVILLEKCVLTILELNWNQHLGHKKTKLNICHHIYAHVVHTTAKPFYVEERTRTSSKCHKMKNARAKRAKILFFIVKYANLWGFCCRRLRGCLSSLIMIVVDTCPSFSVIHGNHDGESKTAWFSASYKNCCFIFLFFFSNKSKV